MTSKERLLTAINKEKPDRLPATIHQWQPYHLKEYMNNISDVEAFKQTGLDASITYFNLIEEVDKNWQISKIKEGKETKYTIKTPKGELTSKEGSNAMTTWITSHLIKKYEDIELIKYMPVPTLDKKGVQNKYEELSDYGILRTFIPFKQGGCWQDACELYGTEQLIYECYDNPQWVHNFLNILLEKKLDYIDKNLKNLPFDLIETGGGAASNTVISPTIHEEFCLPYDKKMHDAIKSLGFKTVYHTCGGMSKITDLIIKNGCDVSETLSPTTIGGDIDSAKTAQKVFDDLFPQVALIGGLDQISILEQGAKGQVEDEVLRLFKLFGSKGGYILSAADHFFEASVENIKAIGIAAKKCTY